ncbi:MAG TPA: IS5 family transposase [Steroidobacteraceae bacterium]|nr:IS5 family transposase [Steroidobacteraceae bacterium]
MKQTTFASLAWHGKGKVTRREQFLGEMNAVIPWKHLNRLIEPHYPKAGNGTQPMPQERMLRIYFMQQWFNLSDPAMEDALYDSESMRRFAGIELSDDAIPDETTILRFRHLLEKHALTQAIFSQVRTLLEQKRLLLKSGTIVDATIIEAPPSTKNADKARDPEMHQTKKGKDWHFGMKAHVGTDQRGTVHSLSTTAANVADINELPKLLHGQEREVFGDQAYWNEFHRQCAKGSGIRYRINRRGTRSKPLSEYQKRINRIRSSARARGEHAFHVVKRLWGFTKVRYRGLAKNTARLFTAFALANLYLLRRRLLTPQGTCLW